jgi:hypothetical protein
MPSEVDVDQFCGIEVEPFPRIAEVAMYLMTTPR